MHSSRRASTEQKMKFSIKDFFSKYDQIRSFMWIWSHLLKKSLMETSFFVQCSGKSPETLWIVSTKFPHQEIRQSNGILCCAFANFKKIFSKYF